MREKKVGPANLNCSAGVHNRLTLLPTAEKKGMVKTMKKVGSVILAVVIFALMIVGCSGNTTPPATTPPATTPPATATPDNGDSDTPAPAASDEPVDLGPAVHLKLGHSMPEQDYRGLGANYFADKVKELSGGNITITVYPSETLTTAQNMIQLVSSGAAELGAGSLSYATAVAPALGVLDIPGTYDPRYFRETYEEIRGIIDEILEPNGVKLMIMFDETDSVFYISKSKAREVHTPADISGLRIRDHGLWLGKTISAWGSNPMTVVPGDMAVALERGTVDGGYTGWGFMNAYRLYEMAPIITFANMSKSAWSPITINLNIWNGLTKAQQDIMTEAAYATEKYTDEYLAEAYATFVKNVESVGGSFYEMTADETAEFIKLAEPVIELARKDTGDLGNKLLDKMLEVKDSFK